MSRKREPWERQESETSKAYSVFLMYRDLGVSRTMAEVGKRLGKSSWLLERWSMKHSWVERAMRWDDEKVRVKDDARKDSLRKEVEHAERARFLFYAAARQAITIIMTDMQEGEFRPKPRDAKALVDAAIALQQVEIDHTAFERASNTMTLREQLETAGIRFQGILGLKGQVGGEKKED